jgi:hypothetical protein
MEGGRTKVTIQGESFYINGSPTYPGRTWRGHPVEGLLLNARLVQGIFDDLNPATRPSWKYPDTGTWDPDRNTAEFVAAMPDWRGHGLLAFTVNMQGGMPRRNTEASQPWLNSAITDTGDLRPEYLARLGKIMDRADDLGMAVILGIFYFGQDERIKDEAAVRKAVGSTVRWVLDGGRRNVLIEINNECNVLYEHPVLQPNRVHELILEAKEMTEEGRRLLVSTSYGGGTIPGENVVRAADFILIHGNGVGDPARIADMVRETRKVPGYAPKPILFNEDDHYDFDRPAFNMAAAIGEYAAWGYYDQGDNNYRDGFQSPPTNWGISSDRKRAFFDAVRAVTGGGL